jgi:peptidoglycan hydrolase CwlO-like protein
VRQNQELSVQLQAREVEAAELRKLLNIARGDERDELKTLREMNAELMGRTADQHEQLAVLAKEIKALQQAVADEARGREHAAAEAQQLRAAGAAQAQVCVHALPSRPRRTAGGTSIGLTPLPTPAHSGCWAKSKACSGT